MVTAVEEAKQLQGIRDKALTQLDEIIAKIERYRNVRDRANKITYADQVYLILINRH